jgi:hypothetical protein
MRPLALWRHRTRPAIQWPGAAGARLQCWFDDHLGPVGAVRLANGSSWDDWYQGNVSSSAPSGGRATGEVASSGAIDRRSLWHRILGAHYKPHMGLHDPAGAKGAADRGAVYQGNARKPVRVELLASPLRAAKRLPSPSTWFRRGWRRS